MSILGPTENFFFIFFANLFVFKYHFNYFLIKKKKTFYSRPTGHSFGHPLDRKQTFFFKGGLIITPPTLLPVQTCPNTNYYTNYGIQVTAGCPLNLMAASCNQHYYNLYIGKLSLRCSYMAGHLSTNHLEILNI